MNTIHPLPHGRGLLWKEINTKFLKGKSKIGVKRDVENRITIYQTCEGDYDLTIEKNLSKVGAYCYLEGFKIGFTVPHWS